MKSCSRFICVFAIIALFVLYGAVATNYVISLTEISESREELEESMDEHSHSKYDDDCSTCENYEEREKSLKRTAVSAFTSSIGLIALYSVFCVTMYGVGMIIAGMGGAKELEKPVCPNCGKIQRKGSKYCYVCGTAVEN